MINVGQGSLKRIFSLLQVTSFCVDLHYVASRNLNNFVLKLMKFLTRTRFKNDANRWNSEMFPHEASAPGIYVQKSTKLEKKTLEIFKLNSTKFDVRENFFSPQLLRN